MQRSSVDLPDPEGPMMHTTPPFGTSNDTPFSTSTVPTPKDLSATIADRRERWRRCPPCRHRVTHAAVFALCS